MKAVVCDNGSGSIKCGFAGALGPQAVIPTVVGRPLFQQPDSSSDSPSQQIVVGEECFLRRGELKLSHPISNGIVQKWEDMGHIWDYVFNQELQIDPSESRILLTDPPLNPSSNRQKLVETMFEKYGFESLLIQLQAVLPLYAVGELTGLVVDSGETVTHCVPVVEGYAYTHLSKRLSVAGRQVTQYLIDLLLRQGYVLSKTGDMDAMRAVKEKLCYVSCDVEREEQLAEDTAVLVKKYTLPDGRSIKVGAERFQAAEVLFRPELIDKEEPGLADVIFKAIQETDIDHRMSLYQHITLSGGTTMFPGLPTRLESEIKERYVKHVVRGNREALKKLKLRVEDPPNRRHLVFVGGAVLADIMKDKPDFWISRQEYLEEGLNCLRKCEG